MLKNKTGTVYTLMLVFALFIMINTISIQSAFGAAGDFTINLSNPPNPPVGSTITLTTGSTVKATIAAEVGTNVLGSYDILLRYNGNVLSYSASANLIKNPQNAQSLGSILANEQAAGQVSMNWYQSDFMSTDDVLHGKIDLVEVTFTVQGGAGSTTDLNLDIVALVDPDSIPIGTTRQLTGGPVTVSVPAEIDTLIGSKPASPTTNVTAQFTFSATLTASKYECQLDSGSYATCTSPQDYTSLSDGSHTFSVRAYNESGTPDSTPASYTWTVDLTPPATTATPAAGTYNASQSVVLTANETATIYYTTDGTDPTVNSSQYSGAINIGANTTLKYFAKDSVGNVETIKSSMYVIKITDSVVPTVTAFSIPATSSTLITTITTFTATDNVGVTGYMVTESSTAPTAANTKWRTTVPTYYSFATTGAKTLYAWAKDAAGNVSASMSASVNVDTTPPTPLVGEFVINLSNPPNPSTGSVISVATGSTVKATIAAEVGTNVLGSYDILLRYNGDVLKYTASANLVKNPQNAQSLGSLLANEQAAGQLSMNWYQSDFMSTDDVLHGKIDLVEVTFTVQGVAGSSTDLNLDISALVDPDSIPIGTPKLIGSVKVSVLGEINTIIDSQPANPTNSGAAQFTFSDSIPASKYECQIDSGTYETCTSPQNYTGLTEGSHTFSVRAYNMGGVPDDTPATYTWTIDLTLPTTTATPAAGSYNVSQSVTLSASEQATIYYTTDGSDPSENSLQYSGAIDVTSTTTIKYFARDAAGNSETIKTGLYTIDTTPPTVTGFNLPTSAYSRTVTITTFTATDNVGVTVYMATESATAPGAADAKWSYPAPANYTFATAGAKTLYAWAKDAAGNISVSMSANTTLILDIDFTIAKCLYDVATGFVNLTWTNAEGQNYDLQYSDEPYSDTMNWTLLQGNITPGNLGTTYTDDGSITGKTPGDQTLDRRYYRVALTGMDPAAYSSDWCGVYSTQLVEGMNLVSFPLMPESPLINASIGNQLIGATAASSADRIWYWDKVGKKYDYAWLSTRLDRPGWLSTSGILSTLSLDPDKGFWVQIRAGHGTKKLKMAGRIATTNQVSDMVTGMQLFGSSFPVEVSLADANITAHGATAASSADRIWYWDRVNQKYDYAWLSTRTDRPGWLSSSGTPATFTLKPGYGYWLQVRDQYQGFTWTYTKPYLR